jgi:hypothetical protein
VFSSSVGENVGSLRAESDSVIEHLPTPDEKRGPQGALKPVPSWVGIAVLVVIGLIIYGWKSGLIAFEWGGESSGAGAQQPSGRAWKEWPPNA